MEKVESKVIKVTENKHIFYCDGCKKKLGESIECDDGYYETIGNYEQRFYLSGVNDIIEYKLNLNLCDECKEFKNKQIIEALESVGFQKYGDNNE